MKPSSRGRDKQRINAGMQGFIVDAGVGYDRQNRRPCMRLYGRSEDGGCFVVNDTRVKPYFFAAAVHKERLPPHTATQLVDLRGASVVRLEAPHANDAAALAEFLARQGITTYESDLRFSSRYLIDRGLRGSIHISGASRMEHERTIYDDPSLAPSSFVPTLRVLSFDIETNATGSEVYAIALHGGGPDRVLLHAPHATALPDFVTPCASEAALLQAFVAQVRARDPDILTGWNVIDFDLSVLQAACKRLRVPLALGRDDSEPWLRFSRSYWASSQARVNGRMVLDGIALLRGAFIPMEEYGLDAVGKEVLGVGKTIGAGSKLAEIQRLYQHDLPQFCIYNLNDATLVTRILDKLGLIPLAIARSCLTGMPLNRVSGSIAAFDSLYLPELRKRGVVADAVQQRGGDIDAQHGGLVLEPTPGLYKNVLSFDFKSLYPSVMRSFNIDPLSHARAASDPDPIIAPNGARFAREPGILPGILDVLVPSRDAAKAKKDAVASHAIKILMNSLYGVLGSPSCRFYDREISNAITGFGREILLWTKARFEDLGYRVLYGDTDSLFVDCGIADERNAVPLAETLAHDMNSALARHLRDTWGVTSRLELEFDTHYLRLFLAKTRHTDSGARKRYAGLSSDKEVVFTGMEVVRRDWTELAKRTQRELFTRLFHDAPVESYVKELVRAVLTGARDHELVYKKALRKPLADYTASTPPHVAAARKQRERGDKRIAYVMTVKGPEPIDAQLHPLDRMHYIEKQLRPVAEPVLALLGLSFDDVAEMPGQMRLL